MQISFKKLFRKLLDQDGRHVVASAALLAVIKISGKSELSNDFIEYDTDMDYTIEENTPLLMLLFLKPSTNNTKNIFATVRVWSEEKEQYYRTAVGNDFNIIIEKD